MFNHQFYYQLTRKYVIIFGTLFNNIHITREDATGNVVQLLKVPLSYAPKDKMLARITQDPTNEKETAIDLPRMSFELSNMYYDGNRQMNKIHRTSRISDDPNKLQYNYSEVPYNYNFSLHIYVKNSEDGFKIIEQIMPFFTPDWNMTAELIPENNIKRDIPIVHVAIQNEDQYEGQFNERRPIIWTLDFIMKAYMYGPIKKKPIIKFANTNFYFGSNSSNAGEVVSEVQVKPGLDANGNPTSNASVSVNTNLIEATDDFGYIITQSGLIITE